MKLTLPYLTGGSQLADFIAAVHEVASPRFQGASESMRPHCGALKPVGGLPNLSGSRRAGVRLPGLHSTAKMWTEPRRRVKSYLIMESMAQRLGETAHCSPLLRKVRRLGISSTSQLIQLAARRGCRHYAGLYDEAVIDPGLAVLSNEEIVALLLLGEQPFEPFTVRCAAQLLNTCDSVRLARLAERERVKRTLAYIVDAGCAQDPENAEYRKNLRQLLGATRPVPPGRLPHWTRFVAQTGVTRQGPGRTVWLRASP